jgi:cAMP-specific phosphodiesterase 4
MLEICLHSADVSTPVREFEVVKKWTYLLFEEFFMQGDLERESGLPISMLCDRTTTNVTKSQPGFIGFVTLPLFHCLAEIMPALCIDVEQIKSNLNQWKNY